MSGHGTPAAVIMAITHSIAHTYPGPPLPPQAILSYVNEQLALRYTAPFGAFVTAFYGIYDPATRVLRYACAGHNPPRLKHCDTGEIESLDQASSLPLGIDPEEKYRECLHTFRPGDQIIFYTDGMTEARTRPASSSGRSGWMRLSPSAAREPKPSCSISCRNWTRSLPAGPQTMIGRSSWRESVKARHR